MKMADGTEASIIEAARVVFIQKGLAGARMQEIADEAKVNKALLNYYFRSKEKLFLIVFEEAIQNLFLKTSHILNTDLEFENKLRQIIENEFDFISENPQLPLFLLNEISKNNKILKQNITNSRVQSILKKFSNEVAQEVQSGRIREISGEELFVNIISLVMFPFVSQNLLDSIFKHNQIHKAKIYKARKAQIVTFILNSIRK